MKWLGHWFDRVYQPALVRIFPYQVPDKKVISVACLFPFQQRRGRIYVESLGATISTA
jgi:hypothetical protein